MIPLIISPARIAVAVVISGVIGFGAGWQVNSWRLGKQFAQIERDQAATAEVASETARLKERAWNKQLEDSRNEATKREIALRRDAADAHHSADGLRVDLEEFRRKLPELAADACRQRADTLARVLDSCQQEYRAVAEDADRISSDRQTLIDSWPK